MDNCRESLVQWHTNGRLHFFNCQVIHQALNNPKLARLLDERCATLNQQSQEGPLFTPFWLQVLAKLRGTYFVNHLFKYLSS